MERPGEPACFEAAIKFFRLLFRLGIDQDDGVDRRPVSVVRIDSAKVLGDERPAGKGARFHRVVDLGDGGFFDFELLCEERDGDEEKDQRARL